MIALLGSLLGFVGSLVPELFKFWNDKADKAHELAIMQLQLQSAQADRDVHLEEIRTTADTAESVALYQTYRTGVTWVDAYNGTVRPTITYAFFLLYALVKLLTFQAIGEHAPLSIYLDILWRQEDQAIFAGIISFYFGQRALAKMRGK